MVTPFDKMKISIFKTVKADRLFTKQWDGFLVVAGTTGESPTLSEEEKVALIQYSVKEAAGRAPIIAGTGSNNTKASIKLTKKLKKPALTLSCSSLRTTTSLLRKACTAISERLRRKHRCLSCFIMCREERLLRSHQRRQSALRRSRILSPLKKRAAT